MLEQLGMQRCVQFTPHLLPIPRGILSTNYVKLAKPVSSEELEQSLREFYAGQPWVRVFGAARLPQIKFSSHNFATSVSSTFGRTCKRAVFRVSTIC